MSAEETSRIQAQIDECSASGGGRITISSGLHVCGSLFLKDGTELHLEQGAILRASDDPSLFKSVGGHDEALTANSGFGALLNASDAKGIAITGSGTIDGGGSYEMAPSWTDAQDMFRPAVAYMSDCQDLRIESVRIVGAKWWTLHLLRCADTIIRGVQMLGNWPNSDGIDPDGCRNMVISDCIIDTGDDCIVLKSTQGDTCENITISNCVLKTTCAALKLGTESRGVFRNIAMSNCTLEGNVAIGLYMKDGGLFENVVVSNMIVHTQSSFPILVDAMSRDYSSGEPAGRIRNIRMSNLVISGPGRVWIEGTRDEPVENISITDVDWYVTKALGEARHGKPTGTVRVKVDPDRKNYAIESGQVIAVNGKGLTVRNFRVMGETRGRVGSSEENLSNSSIDVQVSD